LANIRLLALALVLLACAAQSPGRGSTATSLALTVEDFIRWDTFYYVHPEPERTVSAIAFMQENELLAREPTLVTAVSLGQIFRQNPERIEVWYREIGDRGVRSNRVIWEALWWSSTDPARQILKSEAEKHAGSEDGRWLAYAAAKFPPDFVTVKISSPEILDALWGAFFATGDDRYVRRIIDVLEFAEPNVSGIEVDAADLLLGSAAKWSLTSNASIHPEVLDICRAEAEFYHPRNTLAHLDAVIRTASSHRISEDEYVRQSAERFQECERARGHSGNDRTIATVAQCLK
jgi:hypothetical protein